LRAEGELVEGGGGVLEAGGGGADLGEAVLEEIDLQIGLLLERLQLLHAQLVDLDARGARHGCLLAAAGEMGRGGPEERRRRWTGRRGWGLGKRRAEGREGDQ
jgi:hypothetical protein